MALLAVNVLDWEPPFSNTAVDALALCKVLYIPFTWTARAALDARIVNFTAQARVANMAVLAAKTLLNTLCVLRLAVAALVADKPLVWKLPRIMLAVAALADAKDLYSDLYSAPVAALVDARVR